MQNPKGELTNAMEYKKTTTIIIAIILKIDYENYII